MKVEFEVTQMEGEWLRELTDVHPLGFSPDPNWLSPEEEEVLFRKIRVALARAGFVGEVVDLLQH